MDIRHSSNSAVPDNFEQSEIAKESELPDSSLSADGNNSQIEQSTTKLPGLDKKSPKSPKWGAILAAMLLVLGAGGGWYWWQSSNGETKTSQEQEGDGPRAVSVKVAPVELTSLEETSEFVGTLEAEQSVSIRSEMDGRVIDIYVRPGDRISQGTAIARLDSREAEVQLRQAQAGLINAQARLAELQAGTRREEIAQARARLQQTEARLAELKAGNRGENIAQARSRLRQAEARLQALSGGSRNQEIAQADAQIADAQARLDLSAQKIKRNQELLNEGAISRDRFDEVVAENRRAAATLEQAKQRLEELEKSQREDREEAEAEVTEAEQALALQESGARPEEIAFAEAQVEERWQELRELENGPRPEEIAAAEAEVAQMQAQVRAYEVAIEDTRAIAPFSGVIGDVPVKIGDYLNRGDVLTNLTENNSLELRLFIPINRLSDLRLGLPVFITNTNTNTKSNPNNQSLGKGRISFISPQVNAESQTVLTKVTVDNSKSQLLDGQFVGAKLIWNQRMGAVIVPATAVVFQGEERFMYLVEQSTARSEDGEPQMTAKKQPVKLGLVQGDRIEIIEGLEPGDQIITSGIQKLADGSIIRVMR